MNRALLIAPFLSLTVGCSGTERRADEPPATAAPEANAAPSLPPEPPPTGPRAIDQPATFAGLVTAANTLTERGEGSTESACLLRRPQRRGWPWILEAEVAASVRPLPEPPEDLDARLAVSGQPVLVITRWAQLGLRSYDIALASFTDAPPTLGQPAEVLLLTDRGLYRRRTDQRVSAGRFGPRPLPERGAPILDLEEGLLVFVTAEAGVPLGRLRRLLAALPEGSHVAFATALGEEIRVPDPPPTPPDRGTGLCPDGLPAPPPGSVMGQIGAEQVIGALDPLRQRARACFETEVPTQAPGGLMTLMIRIGPDGGVSETCLLEDDLGGTALRNCVLEAARASRFPAPQPEGYVDVQIPLRFQPTYQRALCE